MQDLQNIENPDGDKNFAKTKLHLFRRVWIPEFKDWKTVRRHFNGPVLRSVKARGRTTLLLWQRPFDAKILPSWCVWEIPNQAKAQQVRKLNKAEGIVWICIHKAI